MHLLNDVREFSNRAVPSCCEYTCMAAQQMGKQNGCKHCPCVKTASDLLVKNQIGQSAGKQQGQLNDFMVLSLMCLTRAVSEITDNTISARVCVSLKQCTMLTQDRQFTCMTSLSRLCGPTQWRSPELTSVDICDVNGIMDSDINLHACICALMTPV